MDNPFCPINEKPVLARQEIQGSSRGNSPLELIKGGKLTFFGISKKCGLTAYEEP